MRRAIQHHPAGVSAKLLTPNVSTDSNENISPALFAFIIIAINSFMLMDRNFNTTFQPIFG